RDEKRTYPNGGECGQREAEGDLIETPVIILLKIIVEERQVVIWNANRDPEGDEGGCDNPPAVENALCEHGTLVISPIPLAEARGSDEHLRYYSVTIAI